MAESHTTEAGCLLEQGASYIRRIGLTPLATAGDPIFAGFKHGAFSIYHGDAPIYHFDLEGRWQRTFEDGTHYLKGLDAAVQSIVRVREGRSLILKRKTLTPAEADNVDARVRSMALQLIADLDADRLRRKEPPALKARPLDSSDLRAFLHRIARWHTAAWSDQRRLYEAAYSSSIFVPPECQNAVVLQATWSDTGDFESRDSPAAKPTARTPAEFERHTKQVAQLWGRRLLQSRMVFLAGSDVLLQPQDDVESYFSAIGNTVPLANAPRLGAVNRSRDLDETAILLDGVHAMLDDFGPTRPRRASWLAYASLGLVRASLGVWSGDPEIRGILCQSWDNAGLQATLADLKAAGLGASILIVVGAGGAERGSSHVSQTAGLVASLPLTAGDFVFLLDEREIRHRNWTLDELTSLDGLAWSEQQAELKESLAPLKKRGIKVLPYTMEKQGA